MPGQQEKGELLVPGSDVLLQADSGQQSGQGSCPGGLAFCFYFFIMTLI